jgi:RHS repeat-associated protein
MYDCPLHHAFLAHHFTGKERDAESSLDEFGARYYGSSLGRFMKGKPGTDGTFTNFHSSKNR